MAKFMKKKIISLFTLHITLFLLLDFCICFASIKVIAPGITYEHIIKSVPHNLSVHELIIDPKLVRIEIAQAKHQQFQAKKVSEFVKNNNAIAGINGSFFDFGQNNLLKDAFVKAGNSVGLVDRYSAFPVFCLKIKENWFSLSSKLAGVIGWSADGKVIFDTLKITWRVKINNLFYPVSAINKIQASGPILYSPAFGTTTPVKRDVTEYVIDNTGVITSIEQTHGSVTIPENGFVYSVGKRSKKVINIGAVKSGSRATIKKKYETGSTNNIDWEAFDFLVGSTPLLVRDSKIQDTVLNGKSRFFKKQYARSAIGLFPDGKWLFLVVEAGQAKKDGMTLLELAQYFLDRGCVSALNLDGGGSSTLVIDNQLINKPSGREWGVRIGKASEIPVAHAFLLFPKL